VRDFPDKVRFQSVRSERDVEDFARNADAISRKTYRHALGKGFVNNLEMRETLRAAAKRAALRACVLHVGDQPVAFASAILSNKKLYGTFTAYDSDFEKYHPGLQTLMRLIEESCESSGGLSQIDAGCGDSAFKRALFHSSWMESPVWIFAPSAKGLSLHAFKALSTLLHSFAMRFLAKSHQLRKIRRMWHSRAMRQFST
jgi:CelD/BcsL family acetyltransferase involved in cellulose biosynthesis